MVRCTPDRDVLLARGGELRAAPVGVAGFEFHARDLGHQVALGGPDVTEVPRAVPNRAVIAAPVVVRRALLRRQVVGVEDQVVAVDGDRYRRLARRKPADGWHPQFDDEPAAGAQVSGGIAEALDLRAWVRRFAMLFHTR